MTANSFIAVEGRLSTHEFRHCLSRCWGISAGSEYSGSVQSDGLSLVAEIQLPTQYWVAHTDSCWYESHIKNRMI